MCQNLFTDPMTTTANIFLLQTILSNYNPKFSSLYPGSAPVAKFLEVGHRVYCTVQSLYHRVRVSCLSQHIVMRFQTLWPWPSWWVKTCISLEFLFAFLKYEGGWVWFLKNVQDTFVFLLLVTVSSYHFPIWLLAFSLTVGISLDINERYLFYMNWKYCPPVCLSFDLVPPPCHIVICKFFWQTNLPLLLQLLSFMPYWKGWSPIWSD